MAHNPRSAEEAIAWIGGEPASLDEAAATAAERLRRSRQPLFCGLGADIDGARSAITLAEQLGGVVDHDQSASLLRVLDCYRQGGVMMTTPTEARARADLVLLVGTGLERDWPDIGEQLLTIPARPDGAGTSRTIICLADRGGPAIPGIDSEVVSFGAGSIFAANLAALRARVNGRKISAATAVTSALDALAAQLRTARFGVAVWSAARLDALAVDMIHGLVRDLNKTTRFSTLALAPPDNGAGVLAACGWMTGFPMRTGFGAGFPVHDPWRFDAERLARSGECDCALWISAFGSPPPPWSGDLDFIALSDVAPARADAASVRIRVGCPGVGHPGVVHSARTGGLIAMDARQPGRAPSVAQALRAVAAHLGGVGAV